MPLHTLRSGHSYWKYPVWFRRGGAREEAAGGRIDTSSKRTLTLCVNSLDSDPKETRYTEFALGS